MLILEIFEIIMMFLAGRSVVIIEVTRDAISSGLFIIIAHIGLFTLFFIRNVNCIFLLLLFYFDSPEPRYFFSSSS
jgi:hypothetical protein